MKSTALRKRVPPANDPGEQPPLELPEEAAISRRRGCSPFRVALGLVLVIVAACVLGAILLGLAVSGDSGRTNILLLGIDRRSGTGWGYRTDTIIIFTLDPDTRSAGLLSIPRDLQLTIPGYGDDRVNTANVYGYQGDFPGGGPALLQATLRNNLGLSIDGHVMADFQTLVRLVDLLGGIDVDVSQTLHDTQYPDPRPGDPYAFKTIHFDPGRQHMDGTRALEYARSRMSTSDFDRALRQQQVLVAIRDKALSPAAILHWPALAAAILDGTQRGIDVAQIPGLALAILRLDPTNLKQVVLEPPLVYGYRRADGAAIQLPRWDLINPVLDDLFGRQEAK